MDSSQRASIPAVLTAVKRAVDWYELWWSDGYCGQYPFVWLRDNCRCAQCFYPSSKQRSSLLCDIDVDIVPASEELDNDGQEFKVTWRDDHVSPYSSHWLYLSRFDKTDFDSVKKLTPKAWGSEMQGNVPKFDYDMVMEDARTLRDWLRRLYVDGLTILSGAPKEEGVIENIGKRVGHLRTTMYGKTNHVIAMASPSNLAYTTKRLGLHVDLPVYDSPPSIQMLHCIKQCESTGGESQFSDIMKVVSDLKETDPDVYITLTKVKVDFRLRGADYVPYHFQCASPVIVLDDEGNFQSVRHNNGVRAPYLNLPPEKVKHFYKCLSYFDRKLNGKEYAIEFKLKEGDVVVCDNNRVMHGRSGFELTTQEEAGKKTRHLEGGFLDWDIIKSSLRLLDEELDDVPVL